MLRVQALRGFFHGEERRKHSKFKLPDDEALDLAKTGLVRVLVDKPDAGGPVSRDPEPAAGQKSSASPAAQASPPRTATRSGTGRGRRTVEES